MRDLTEIFQNKKPDPQKLTENGFIRTKNGYTRVFPLENYDMELKVLCRDDGVVTTEITDNATGEEYTLYLIDDAQGEFVGKVRTSVINILTKIASDCFSDTVFRHSQISEILKFVKERYGDDPEFPWDDENAVLRRKNTGKWYGVIMRVGGNKFGHDPVCDEIIDLHSTPEKIEKLADGKNYFRGYHMNKRHWLTIVLDGSVPTAEICALTEESYALAVKKNNHFPGGSIVNELSSFIPFK